MRIAGDFRYERMENIHRSCLAGDLPEKKGAPISFGRSS